MRDRIVALAIGLVAAIALVADIWPNG